MPRKRRPGAKKQSKLRRDATLKKLPLEQQQLVRAWLEEDGEGSCRQRIFSELHIASPKDPTQPISTSTLYDAIEYWDTQAITDGLRSYCDAQTELFAQFNPGDAELARKFGEFMMLQRANKTQDKDIFAVATMAQDSRRRLDLETESAKTKARQKDQQLSMKAEEVAVLKQKFRRDTCELFLEWLEKKEALDIAHSGASQDEKTERLGRAMFGELWDK
jgi:hypothetical protein